VTSQILFANTHGRKAGDFSDITYKKAIVLFFEIPPAEAGGFSNPAYKKAIEFFSSHSHPVLTR
jgi:hypothetical protein